MGEMGKTPLGLGLTLDPNGTVSEVSADSQAARDGKIKVGDRIVSINGETPTSAKPSSAILQGIAAGTTLKLELASEAAAALKAAGISTELGQSSSVSAAAGESATSSEARSLPLAVLVRDAQKMRRASELLEDWKIAPSELTFSNRVGAGGQADVYAGRWQVRPSRPLALSPSAKPLHFDAPGPARCDQEAAQRRPPKDQRSGPPLDLAGGAPRGARARSRATPECSPAARSLLGADALPRDGLCGGGWTRQCGARGPLRLSSRRGQAPSWHRTWHGGCACAQGDPSRPQA